MCCASTLMSLQLADNEEASSCQRIAGGCVQRGRRFERDNELSVRLVLACLRKSPVWIEEAGAHQAIRVPSHEVWGHETACEQLNAFEEIF